MILLVCTNVGVNRAALGGKKSSALLIIIKIGKYTAIQHSQKIGVRESYLTCFVTHIIIWRRNLVLGSDYAETL